jgi:hypothetical protein
MKVNENCFAQTGVDIIWEVIPDIVAATREEKHAVTYMHRRYE